MIKMILALGMRGELGDSKNPNGLPWSKNIEDLDYFKSATLGDKVVYGNNTFKSFISMGLPNGLPDRENIVLTNSGIETPILEVDVYKPLMKVNKETLLGILEEFKEDSDPTVWVIGGKCVYEQLLSFIEEVHLTRICRTFPLADTYLGTDWLRSFTLKEEKQLNSYSKVEIWRRKCE